MKCYSPQSFYLWSHNLVIFCIKYLYGNRCADKPEIYVKKPWVHAYPGIRVQLDCTVTAWPEAKVRPTSLSLSPWAVTTVVSLINSSNNDLTTTCARVRGGTIRSRTFNWLCKRGRTDLYRRFLRERRAAAFQTHPLNVENSRLSTEMSWKKFPDLSGIFI